MYRIVDCLLKNLENPGNLIIDLKNNWIMSFIGLEKQVSELINYCVRRDIDLINGSLIHRLLAIYQHTLTRLCLFSSLDSEHKATVCQHLQTVALSTENWLPLVEKCGQHGQLLSRQAREIRCALQVINNSVKPSKSEPLVREMQEMLAQESPLFVSSFGDFCAYWGFWTQAELYYRMILSELGDSEGACCITS
jgi:hypothetical protein